MIVVSRRRRAKRFGRGGGASDPNVIPYDSPTLHPDRIEGDLFSDYANFAAWSLTLAGRFDADHTLQGDETLEVVGGSMALKVPGDGNGFNIAKNYAAKHRVFMRAEFYVPDAAIAGYFVLPTTNETIASNGYINPSYNLDDSGNVENWLATIRSDSDVADVFVSQAYSTIKARWVNVMTLSDHSDPLVMPSYYLWVDGGTPIIDHDSPTRPGAGFNLFQFGGYTVTVPYLAYRKWEYTAWPDGAACPYSEITVP